MRKLLIACIALFSLAANCAYAETYNYTGQYFTFGEGAEYAEGMSVTGSITTSGPIPPNSVNLDIRPLIIAWTFNDGVQTLSSANGDLLHQVLGEAPPLSFSTDALGNITSADIMVQDVPEPTTIGGTVNVIYTFGSIPVDAGILDFTCLAVVNDQCSEYELGTGFAMSESMGTWGPVKSPITPVPTMSVWGLVIFVALLGLIGFSRRRYI